LHVWYVLFDAVDAARAESLLDSRERARAGQFVHARDRLRYVARHAALRSILAGYLGVLPSEIVYSFACAVCGSQDHGKPFLASLPLFGFNMSSSTNAAVVAVSANADVGVDIERVGRRLDEGALVSQYTYAERDALAGMAQPARGRAIIESWTRKEAYIKALGLGLFLPLDAFELTMPPLAPRVVRASAESCAMATVAVPAPYVATVAWTGPDRDVRLWRGCLPSSGELRSDRLESASARSCQRAASGTSLFT